MNNMEAVDELTRLRQENAWLRSALCAIAQEARKGKPDPDKIYMLASESEDTSTGATAQ